MQGRRPICYHLDKFNRAVLNYPMYEKELYYIFYMVKKWKHYLMEKEIIIHTDLYPLHYLENKSKL